MPLKLASRPCVDIDPSHPKSSTCDFFALRKFECRIHADHMRGRCNTMRPSALHARFSSRPTKIIVNLALDCFARKFPLQHAELLSNPIRLIGVRLIQPNPMIIGTDHRNALQCSRNSLVNRFIKVLSRDSQKGRTSRDLL